VLKKASYISKQVIAFLLLGIFVSIHAVKMLHTHTDTEAAQLQFDGDLIEKKGGCNICDYHLTKDAVTVASSFDLAQLHHANVSSSFYKRHPFSSIGLYYADRGPPATA
jgi:hypothetical protein